MYSFLKNVYDKKNKKLTATQFYFPFDSSAPISKALSISFGY